MKKSLFYGIAITAISALMLNNANAQSSATTQRNGTVTYHHPEVGGMNVTITPLTPEQHAKAIKRDKDAKEKEIKAKQTLVGNQQNAVNLDAKSEKLTDKEKQRLTELVQQKGKEAAFAIAKKQYTKKLTALYGTEEAERITNLKMKEALQLFK